jgi:predicted secreted Zn-dependent protease
MSNVEVRVSKDFYPVVGSTRDAVLRSIDEKGPHKGGDHFVAYTSWDVTWGFELRDVRGLLHVVSPFASVGAHVILPSWKDKTKAPKDLREHVEKSIDAIQKHESEHVAMAIEAGDKALKKLRSIRPARDLDRKRIDGLVGAEIAAIQKRERWHDKVTKNGITQGTWI